MTVNRVVNMIAGASLFQMGFAGFCLVPSIACVLGLKDGAGVACSAS
jgi:hypothetical protein